MDKEKYSLNELKEIIEHEKYLRKENQELYEELQVLRKCSDGTNDLANEYYKRIKKAVEYIEKFKKEWDVVDEIIFNMNELIDILKGDDTNES